MNKNSEKPRVEKEYKMAVKTSLKTNMILLLNSNI